MSHNLHRRGSIESLQNDMPLLTKPAQGINKKGSGDKLREFVKISLSHKPVNLGLNTCGNIFTVMPEDILQTLEDGRTINVVFDNKNDFIALLKHLKEIDWDLSITCAGLYQNTLEACTAIGIKPHSANFSLGIFGKTELLPREEILEFTTMCGHHQITANLVETLIDKIKAKKMTSKDASIKLAKQCPCGIFNTARGEQMFDNIVN